MISNPIPYSPVQLTDSEVFNAASPNPSAWTDLDLSAIVGSRRAFVMLRCYNPNGAAKDFCVRRNGETEFIASGFYGSVSVSRCNTLKFIVICCFTDDAGIIEWYYSQAAEAGTTIDVVGYVT